MSKYTPEKVAEVIELLRRGDGNGCRASSATMVYAADILAAVSAERYEAREAAEDHVLAAEATYERLMPRIKKAEAERDRLHKAITELARIAKHCIPVAEVDRILRAALEQKGGDDG